MLDSLIKRLEQEPLNKSLAVTWEQYPQEPSDPKANLSQDYLWSALAKLFRPGDVVIGETGTSGGW